MELVRVTATDTDLVDAYLDIVQAAEDADGPASRPLTRRRVTAELEFGWDGEPPRTFIGFADGVPVGAVSAYGSSHDNTGLAWLELQVHPDHRRRGHGTDLLRVAGAVCLADGRPLVVVEGWESAALRGFAEHTGFPVKQVTVIRDQPITRSEAERSRFEALRVQTESASADYDLLRLEGRTPDELVERLVAATETINDAPLDDLDYDAEVFSAARIRAYEEAQLAAGARFRRILAVHRATGEIAGHTVTATDSEQPRYAEQHDTSVLPAHRGHRLGLRLKTDMLCWLAEVEPALTVIRTENAESNGPMIAVNEQLGYRVAGRRLVVQRRL